MVDDFYEYSKWFFTKLPLQVLLVYIFIILPIACIVAWFWYWVLIEIGQLLNL